MKAALVGTLLLFGHCCASAGDPKTSGGMSDLLALSFAFDDRSQEFMVTLTSTSKLNVQVEATNFHGRIIVEGKGKPRQEYYEKRYRMMLLTSEWIDPRQDMASGTSIVWKLPVAQLRDVQGRRLRLEQLDGACAWAELDQVAVVPPDGNYIQNNAKQKSAKIYIKVEPDGSADGSQPVPSETIRTSSAAGSRR